MVKAITRAKLEPVDAWVESVPAIQPRMGVFRGVSLLSSNGSWGGGFTRLGLRGHPN